MTQGAPSDQMLNFIDLMIGGPRARADADPEQVAQRLANLQRWAAEFDDVSWPGEFGVWTLTERDKVYLDSVADAYKLKTGQDLMRDGIVGGKNRHLNEVRNTGVALRGQYDLSTYDSPLKAAVERRMA